VAQIENEVIKVHSVGITKQSLEKERVRVEKQLT